MVVTINTDASFNKKHQIGSYAFWIVSNMGRIQHSGILRSSISRSEISEFQCIINAVHVLGILGWGNIEHIIINTDCLNVIHLISGDETNIKYHKLEWGLALVKQFNKTLAKNKLGKAKIDMRHVKSHGTIDSKRTFVNNWCDKSAKEMMGRKIRETEKK